MGAKKSKPENDGVKSKKPSGSKFNQQKLPSWQPIITAGTVWSTFIIIGILFIPVGIGLWYFSENVKEQVIDYTNCKDENGRACAKNDDKKDNSSTTDDGNENETTASGSTDDGVTTPTTSRIPNRSGSSEPTANPSTTDNNGSCTCKVEFKLESGFKGKKVYMYYALTNFYQNHRRYVKSKNDKQLRGEVFESSGKAKESKEYSDCQPFDKEGDQVIYPCGAIANSMFNDIIKLEYTAKNGSSEPVKLLSKGIAWESDKSLKFKNPKGGGSNSSSESPESPAGSGKSSKNGGLGQFAKPKDWVKPISELGDKETGTGVENEDFIVWMRTEALPNFRKLYRIIDQSKAPFKNGMPAGNYTLIIDYNFQVTKFQGTKKIVFSTTTLVGGKNPFLGIAYILVGALCIIIGVMFLSLHLMLGKGKKRQSRKTSHHSNRQSHDSSAAATRKTSKPGKKHKNTSKTSIQSNNDAESSAKHSKPSTVVDKNKKKASGASGASLDHHKANILKSSILPRGKQMHKSHKKIGHKDHADDHPSPNDSNKHPPSHGNKDKDNHHKKRSKLSIISAAVDKPNPKLNKSSKLATPKPDNTKKRKSSGTSIASKK